MTEKTSETALVATEELSPRFQKLLERLCWSMYKHIPTATDYITEKNGIMLFRRPKRFGPSIGVPEP